MPRQTTAPATEPTTERPPETPTPPAEPAQQPAADQQPTDPAPQPPPSQDQQNQTGPRRDPVPFAPSNVDEMYRYARMLAGASLLPRSFYDREDRDRRHPKIADVHFVLLKGQALGLHPTVSIATINVIDGKAEIGASLMVALSLKSGLCEYFDLVSTDERAATYATRRHGGRREISFTYTIEMAERLGIATKDNWRKQPDTMLRRRAQSMLAREVYPDVVMGLYDHDELAEMREREVALGIDPDRVIPMNGMPTGHRAADPRLVALPAPGERWDPLAGQQAPDAVPVKREDPLKARLRARTAEASDAPVLGHDESFCVCGVPVLGPPGTKCDACQKS